MDDLSCFEDMPDEVILNMCRYLSSSDVLYSFYNINSRLNITITGYCRHINLMGTLYTQFLHIVGDILPNISEHIQSFVLNCYWETMIQTQTRNILYGSELSLIFPRLRMLTLQWFDSTRLSEFLDNLIAPPQLAVINIRGLYGYKNDLLKKLLTANNNKIETILFDSTSIELFVANENNSPPLISSNIQELKVNLDTHSSLSNLLMYIPNIRQLDVTIKEPYAYSKSFVNMWTLRHLVDFRLYSITLSWSLEEIKQILQLMPSLESLSLYILTKDKNFLINSEAFSILPSKATRINLMIRYSFSTKICDVRPSDVVWPSHVYLLNEADHLLIVYTVPNNISSLVLPESVGTQIPQNMNYPQIEHLTIENSASFGVTVELIKHFRRIHSLNITSLFNNAADILPSTLEQRGFKLPCLRKISASVFGTLHLIIEAAVNLEELNVSFDCLQVLLSDKRAQDVIKKSGIIRLNITNWACSDKSSLELVFETFISLRHLTISSDASISTIDSLVLNALSLWKSPIKVSIGFRGTLSMKAKENVEQWLTKELANSMPHGNFSVRCNVYNWLHIWF